MINAFDNLNTAMNFAAAIQGPLEFVKAALSPDLYSAVLKAGIGWFVTVTEKVGGSIRYAELLC